MILRYCWSLRSLINQHDSVVINSLKSTDYNPTLTLLNQVLWLTWNLPILLSFLCRCCWRNITNGGWYLTFWSCDFYNLMYFCVVHFKTWYFEKKQIIIVLLWTFYDVFSVGLSFKSTTFSYSDVFIRGSAICENKYLSWYKQKYFTSVLESEWCFIILW